MNFVIKASSPASPKTRQLIEKLDNYLMNLYPAESNHLLSVEALQQPEVTFLTATMNETAVGCGAIVNRDGEYAEIKRMFVLPDFRGLKIGRRLLEELESRSLELGLNIVRLETGIYQDEVLSLYEKFGYSRCPPFGHYQADPLSIFMEKILR